MSRLHIRLSVVFLSLFCLGVGAEATTVFSAPPEDGGATLGALDLGTFQRHEAAGARVYFPAGAEAVARHVTDRHAAFTARLRRDWLLEVPPLVTVLLCPDRECMNQALATRLPDWYLAVAVSPRNVIIVGLSQTTRRGTMAFDGTYLHELVHLADKYAPKGIYPDLARWFDEGLAMNIAGTWDLDDAWNLNTSTPPGPLFALSELHHRFPAGRGAAQTAYWQSFHAVGYFLEEYGREALKLLLDSLQEGESFSAAFYDATGTPLDRFEEEWLASQQDWLRWLLRWTTAGSLWVGMSALFVLVIWLHTRRRRALQRRLEWEDLMEDGGYDARDYPRSRRPGREH
jgi:hypothetical protein